MDECFSIAHGGSCGDIIWQLPAMIDIALRAGYNKFRLLLKLNMPASYTEPHPCGNVLLTKPMAESLTTLLREQPYISGVGYWQGEECIDIDRFRLTGFDLAKGDIAFWPCLAYLCAPDLSRPWLTVGPAKMTGKVLVGRSGRYRNPALSYAGLRDAFFVGLPNENDTGLPWLPTPTVLDLAKEIAGCRFFMGNQSLGSAIAAGLGVERALEWCGRCPNVAPHGGRCVPIWTQQQLTQVVVRTRNQ